MIIFAHHQKTAGTTFKYILRANFGWQHCQSAKTKAKVFSQADLNRAKRSFIGLKSVLGHNIIAPTENLKGDNLIFCTILRDPLKRMASHYQDHCLRGGNTLNFKDWCKRYPETHNLQTTRIVGETNLKKAKEVLASKYHFVGLTEDFDRSLKLFKAVCPHPVSIDYNKRNKAQSNKISRSVLEDPESLSLVQATNEMDIKLYNFVKNDLYPNLLRKYKKQIDQIAEPEVLSANTKPFKFRASKFYNNVVFSTLEKVKV